MCKRKGAVMSMVKNEDFKIIKGEDKLILYQLYQVTSIIFVDMWYIHSSQSKIKYLTTGFNLGCLDDVDTFALQNISINDSNNHPLDDK